MPFNLGTPDGRANFRELPKTLVEPTYSFIKNMIQIMRQNTLSVFSSNGNTLGGHQRILQDPLVRTTTSRLPQPSGSTLSLPLALVPWVAGNNIGQVDRDNANYQLQYREYTLFKATIEACNADIFGCMPIDYLGALKDPILGFSHLQTWTIIQHLLANYGEMHARRHPHLP